MTHREQINQALLAMSDEELSTLLADGYKCSHTACPVYGVKKPPLMWCVGDLSCRTAWLRWLKEG